MKYNEIKNQLFTTGYIKIENWLQDNFDNVDNVCLNGIDTSAMIKNKEEIDGIKVFKEVFQYESSRPLQLSYKFINDEYWNRNPFADDGVRLLSDLKRDMDQHLCLFMTSLYGPKIKIFYVESNSHIQFYPPGSYIDAHTDGSFEQDGRIGASLLFLSDKNGEGGELVLVDRNGEKIVYEPSFGDLIVLDMLKGAGISHQVTEVKWDTRFVMASFYSPYLSHGTTVKKIL